MLFSTNMSSIKYVCFSILILCRLAVLFHGNDRDEIFYLDLCIKHHLL